MNGFYAHPFGPTIDKPESLGQTLSVFVFKLFILKQRQLSDMVQKDLHSWMNRPQLPLMVTSCITIGQYLKQEMDFHTIYLLHLNFTNFAYTNLCVYVGLYVFSSMPVIQLYVDLCGIPWANIQNSVITKIPRVTLLGLRLLPFLPWKAPATINLFFCL